MTSATQAGVFTTSQALDAGLDRYELVRLTNRGVLHRVRRGSYALAADWSAATPDEQHVLTARAVLLGLRAPCVLSHTSAVAVRGLRQHGLVGDTVHVTHDVGTGSSRREAGVTHHIAQLPGTDRSMARGLPTTTDAGPRSTSPAPNPVSSGRRRRRCPQSGHECDDLRLALFDAHDHPGARSAGRAIALADGRSESVGETLGRIAFHAVHLPPDALQMSVLTDRGPMRTDYAWTQWRIVGEFDGLVKYGRLLKPGETASDVLVKERQRELAIERAGWGVVRFTWAELFDHELLRSRLLQAVRRSRALASLPDHPCDGALRFAARRDITRDDAACLT
jgi:hypothetical protein